MGVVVLFREVGRGISYSALKAASIFPIYIPMKK
jgi:hypothetical protein